MPRQKILLVDDEVIRHGIRDFLVSRHYEVAESETCEAALSTFASFHPQIVVLDHSLPDGTAVELLPKLKAIDASVPCIVITGFGSIELAVEAIKAGAEQFLTKPVRLDALLLIIEKTLENSRNRRKIVARSVQQESNQINPFLGTSAVILKLRDQVEQVANSESTILIQGETGCGKGVLAHFIHDHSGRADESFLDLNCAGLSRELMESELFGHEKGAFTGAVNAKPGLLEVANRGTVFLDEIGDVDPLIQPKLLKVLEEKQFRRLGDLKDRKVDIRLLAATHQDLATLMESGKFRSDLYFRISTIPLNVPSLRDRIEDIPFLAERLLLQISADLARPGIKLSPDAMGSLKSYAWPGNIRELRNTLERAALLSGKDQLGSADLQFDTRALKPTNGSGSSLRALEESHIRRTLEETHGELARAAGVLGIARGTLYSKIKEYGIEIAKLRDTT